MKYLFCTKWRGVVVSSFRVFDSVDALKAWLREPNLAKNEWINRKYVYEVGTEEPRLLRKKELDQLGVSFDVFKNEYE